MKRAFLILLLLSVAAAHKKVQSPKDAELSSTAGRPMAVRTTSTASLLSAPIFVPPPRTNLVTHRRFEWQEDPESIPLVATYTIYMGTNAGVYNYSEQIGTNLFFEFVRTNWDERRNMHFVVVTATDDFFQESDPSNEVHFPAFPADHVLITWTVNWETCTLYWKSEAWGPPQLGNQLAVLHNTNSFAEFLDLTIPAKFYYLDKPDILTITLFNPNP